MGAFIQAAERFNLTSIDRWVIALSASINWIRARGDLLKASSLSGNSLNDLFTPHPAGSHRCLARLGAGAAASQRGS